jgi:hypothetical protein
VVAPSGSLSSAALKLSDREQPLLGQAGFLSDVDGDRVIQHGIGDDHGVALDVLGPDFSSPLVRARYN